jgi:hypothetical protein
MAKFVYKLLIPVAIAALATSFAAEQAFACGSGGSVLGTSAVSPTTVALALAINPDEGFNPSTAAQILVVLGLRATGIVQGTLPDNALIRAIVDIAPITDAIFLRLWRNDSAS